MGLYKKLLSYLCACVIWFVNVYYRSTYFVYTNIWFDCIIAVIWFYLVPCLVDVGLFFFYFVLCLFKWIREALLQTNSQLVNVIMWLRNFWDTWLRLQARLPFPYVWEAMQQWGVHSGRQLFFRMLHTCVRGFGFIHASRCRWLSHAVVAERWFARGFWMQLSS